MKCLIPINVSLISFLILYTLPYISDAITKDEINIVVNHLKEERNRFPQTPKQETVSLNDLQCNLDQAILDEIHSYQDVVNSIIELFTTGEFKSKTHDYLVQMTDTFGNRMTGSQALKDAIEWFVSNSTSEGLTVYTENFTAPFWVRNEETLEMLSPRYANMNILGLGSTIATPKEGITADVFVVSSFDELTAYADKAAGKIVVFDAPFTTYGDTIAYRTKGAVEAAKAGAVASLTRSVTDFSIDSPHTGWLEYEDAVTKIPSACITIEDSTLLHRLQDRGETITLHLYLGAENHQNGTQTSNTIIEIKGSQNPEEIVVVSGHLDSWDVGVGAMDDGGGVFISWMAARAIKNLGLNPRRTFRTVLFSAEEQGIWGGDAYFVAHGEEKENFQLMMESDMGTFTPYGIDFSGTVEATCMIKEIVSLTFLLGTTETGSPSDTSDLGGFRSVGVPTGSLRSDTDTYFWYHHSNGDRIEVYDPVNLDKVAALWTSVAYVAADISFRLPQQNFTILNQTP